MSQAPYKLTSSVTERVFAAAGVMALSAGAFAINYFNPSTNGFFPVCPLFKLTGFYCPGCGMTRGFHALFHGDILTALHFNALLPIWTALIVYLVLAMALIAIRGRGLSMKPFHPAVLWSFLAVTLVFGIVRNLPFFPFSVLAP